MTTTTEMTQLRIPALTDAPVRAGGEPVVAAAGQRTELRRWAWALTALTIGWNSLEAVIAIQAA